MAKQTKNENGDAARRGYRFERASVSFGTGTEPYAAHRPPLLETPGSWREDDVYGTLVSAVEEHVIPRLLLAQDFGEHKSATRGARGSDYSAPDTFEPCWTHDAVVPISVMQSDIDSFAQLLLSYEPQVAQRYLESQVHVGHALSDLLLDLCGPAAERLGAMWARDECSFCDVTIGMSALEQVILNCGKYDVPTKSPRANQPSILVSAMPGSQHIFGALIVKELFRKEGWSVRLPSAAQEESIISSVRIEHHDVLGLSVSRHDDLPACRQLVQVCRQESYNQELIVVVGGPGVQESTRLTRTLGADLIVRDAREGFEQIERLVARSYPSETYN